MAAGTRITGKLGSISLNNGTDIIADIFEWSAEWEIELEPCGVKTEIAETYSLGGFTGRITAQRFSTTLNADAILAQGQLRTAATAGLAGLAAAGGGGQRIVYVLHQIDGGANGSSLTGAGFIRRGALNSPRAMALDTLEIMMASIPVVS